MAKLSGGHLVVRALKQEGVGAIFTLCGGHIIDIYDGCLDIADGGDVVTMSAGAVQPRQPGHWMDPGPLGTLGVGTPFAIAAKVACPQKEVVLLFGDGAFGCTGFDYDTLVRFRFSSGTRNQTMYK